MSKKATATTKNWRTLVPKIEKYAAAKTDGNLTKAAEHFGVTGGQFFAARTKYASRGGSTNSRPTGNATGINNMVAIMVVPVTDLRNVVETIWNN